MIRFALGFAAGVAATLWVIGRSIGTALTPQPMAPPESMALSDPYLEDLAAILEREQL